MVEYTNTDGDIEGNFLFYGPSGVRGVNQSQQVMFNSMPLPLVGENDLIVPISLHVKNASPAECTATNYALSFFVSDGQEFYSADTATHAYYDTGNERKIMIDGDETMYIDHLVFIWRDYFLSDMHEDLPVIKAEAATLVKDDIFSTKMGSINLTLDTEKLIFVYAGGNYEGHDSEARDLTGI
jgi:hypothetical protein